MAAQEQKANPRPPSSNPSKKLAVESDDDSGSGYEQNDFEDDDAAETDNRKMEKLREKIRKDNLKA